jgi:hypothetical protein
MMEHFTGNGHGNHGDEIMAFIIKIDISDIKNPQDFLLLPTLG